MDKNINNTINAENIKKVAHAEVPGWIDKMSTSLGINKDSLISAWKDGEESGVIQYLMQHNFPKIYLNRCFEMMGISPDQENPDGTIKK